MKRTIGLLTIGQTPRFDLEAAFRGHCDDAEVLVVGALDGLSGEQIAAMSEQESDYPLQTRLADGTVVEVPKEAIEPFFSERASELVDRGSTVVVLACAGDFAFFNCPVPLLIPGRLLPAVVGAITSTRRIGVVTPNAGQINAVRRKWESDGFSVRVASASPFIEAEMHEAAMELNDPELELIVLDCMGHGAQYRLRFARECRRPVLAAQTLLARVANEVAEALEGQVTAADR